MCKVWLVRRTLPALRLERSPLALGLVEVRISPVLLMADYIPAIQERLRKVGYPRYSVSQVQTLLLAPMQPNVAPEVESATRWLFLDEARRTAAVVSPTGVVLETSSYATFDDFVERLGIVIDVVGAEAEIAFSERLGLRYVDVVRPLEGEAVSEYLVPGLHGVPEDAFGGRTALARSEVRAETEYGNLVIRTTRSIGQTPRPPDLQPGDVETPAFLDGDGEVAVLDFDHFSTVNRDFASDVLIDALWDLHDNIDRAFRSAVTPLALERWEASPR